MSTNERLTANQPDLEQIWLQVATDIKIRKIQNLNDIPEFHELPNQLKDELKNAVIGLNDGHKPFHKEEGLICFHAILFIKEKEKYLAIYEEKKPSEQMRSSLATAGLFGVCLFIWHHLFKFFNETQTQQLPLVVNNNSNDITTLSDWNNLLSIVLSIAPSVFAYPLLKRWFSTQDSVYNKLIEGCMLKKLDGISNSQ
jgi:hypothetical protein